MAGMKNGECINTQRHHEPSEHTEIAALHRDQRPGRRYRLNRGRRTRLHLHSWRWTAGQSICHLPTAVRRPVDSWSCRGRVGADAIPPLFSTIWQPRALRCNSKHFKPSRATPTQCRVSSLIPQAPCWLRHLATKPCASGTQARRPQAQVLVFFCIGFVNK